MELIGLAILSLLCISIILHLVVLYRLESQPKPFTFLDYFKYSYDEQERLKKFMKGIAEEAREQALTNYLNLKDEMRRKK